MFIILAGQFPRQEKSQIYTQMLFVQIRKIVHEQQRAAGMDETDMRQIAHTMHSGTKDLSVNSLYYFAEWFMLRLLDNDEAVEHEAHGKLGGIGC
ncbi:MAG: hypothetical protein LBJ59_07740, partial [Zoogloeaceae bacterium]|nr:hypothetical protein [Zoogloeaceae bacterium]